MRCSRGFGGHEAGHDAGHDARFSDFHVGVGPNLITRKPQALVLGSIWVPVFDPQPCEQQLNMVSYCDNPVPCCVKTKKHIVLACRGFVDPKRVA